MEPGVAAKCGWEFVTLTIGGPEGREGLPAHVALIRISRPRSLNVLNSHVLAELEQAALACAADPDVRAVVVAGEGERAFVAGADIAEMAGMDVMDATAFALKGQAALGALASVPKPVIAAIDGYALGGGLELALACDLRVASTRARLGQPEVTLGICPGFGATQRLARLVRPGRAKQLIFAGEHVSGEEA